MIVGEYYYDAVWPSDSEEPCSTGNNCYTYDYGSPSDSRVKTNVVQKNITSEIMHKMNQLETVTYEYLPGVRASKSSMRGMANEGARTGFVAQDMQKVFPYAVAERKGHSLNVERDGNSIDVHDPLHMNMANLVPHLVEAVQFLSEDLTDLKSQADNLLQRASSPSA